MVGSTRAATETCPLLPPPPLSSPMLQRGLPPPEKQKLRAELVRDAHRPASRMPNDDTPGECVKAGAHDLPVALRVYVPAVLNGGVH